MFMFWYGGGICVHDIRFGWNCSDWATKSTGSHYSGRDYQKRKNSYMQSNTWYVERLHVRLMRLLFDEEAGDWIDNIAHAIIRICTLSAPLDHMVQSGPKLT